MRTRLPAILALVCLLAVGGCGGGTKSTATAMPPSATARFLARADAICGGEAGGRPRTSESVERTSLTDVAVTRARTAKRLSALQAPPALQASYRRLVSLIADEATLMRRLEKDERVHNDVGVVTTARELNGDSVSRQARLVGLGECA